MELKGKVSIADAGELLAISANDAEALAALTALGYSIMEAQRALANGAEATSVEDKVLNALRYLGAA